MEGVFRYFIGLFFLFLLSSCGNIKTPYQGERAAIPVSHQASDAYCRPDSTVTFSGTAIFISAKGHDDSQHHDFAEGGGCVLHSLRQTWLASQSRAVVSWEKSRLTDYEPLPHAGVDFFLRTRYAASLAWWIMEWYHTITSGTIAHPKEIVIHYQKVEGLFISYWQGTVVLEAVTDKVTSIHIRNVISAPTQGPDNAADAVRDFITRVRHHTTP